MFTQSEINGLMLMGVMLIAALIIAMFALTYSQQAAIRRREMMRANAELLSMAVGSVMEHVQKTQEPGFIGTDAELELRRRTLASIEASTETILAQHEGPIDPKVEKYLRDSNHRIGAAAGEMFKQLDDKAARQAARA